MDQQLKSEIKQVRACVVYDERLAEYSLQGNNSDARVLSRLLDLLERNPAPRRQQIKCEHRWRPVDRNSRSYRYGWRRICTKCSIKEKAKKHVIRNEE